MLLRSVIVKVTNMLNIMDTELYSMIDLCIKLTVLLEYIYMIIHGYAFIYSIFLSANKTVQACSNPTHGGDIFLGEGLLDNSVLNISNYYL